ncbi:MAG: DedA family protein [Prevotellaceae bacterium]|jgi:membrane protein DedA with SNARE-associated domain|nr:DedA family protein [Prevotellaceae bacterium]
MSIFESVIDWYMANVNYGTITALMTVESSFIPFPSEAIIPQAAFKAAAGELNIVLVVLFATLGAMLGAYFNYFLAKYLGRTIIYRFAETRLAGFFLIDKEKIIKAENYFVENGKSSTLIGRLVPGIRQLISIPAGLANMPLLAFSVYTFIGAALWNVVLAALGYWAHGQVDLMKKYQTELSLAAVLIGVLFIAYLIYSGLKRKRKKTQPDNE